MRPRILLVVALGGVLGACSRVAVSEWLSPADPEVVPNGLAFPWATLIVNVLGCLLIGIAHPALQHFATSSHRRMSDAGVDALRAFIIVGFLGGFTTFSALAAETWLLGGDRNFAVAALYVVVTLVAGLAAVAIGAAMAHRWTRAETP